VRERWGDKLDHATVQETGAHTALLDGTTLGRLAERTGSDSLDVMVDLALADGLTTRFRVVMINDDEEQIAALLANPRFLLGLSDAGAHTSQLCDANYATHLLSHWTRERGTLSLETAVWRLTGQPAAVYGIPDRGTVAPGAIADLVAFDAATVGSGELERVHDLPGGADRLIAASTGIEHVWVSGRPIRTAGRDLPEARPGVVLRSVAKNLQSNPE
jgi:N-acyl-D-aspartate/D-glutamate deacylase